MMWLSLLGIFTVAYLMSSINVHRRLWLLIPLKSQSRVGLLIQSMPEKWEFSRTGYAHNHVLNARFNMGKHSGESMVGYHETKLTAHEFAHVKHAIDKYRRNYEKKLADENLVQLAERIVKVYSHE